MPAERILFEIDELIIIEKDIINLCKKSPHDAGLIIRDWMEDAKFAVLRQFIPNEDEQGLAEWYRREGVTVDSLISFYKTAALAEEVADNLSN